MLAENFLTAKELGLNEGERAGLIKAMRALERGEIKHVKLDHRAVDAWRAVVDHPEDGGNFFNMGIWAAKGPYDCQTVCCIGGWAQAFYDETRLDGLPGCGLLKATRGNRQLYDLFHPSIYSSYDDITPAEAALAIRNYLTTGDACWSQVVP